MKNKITLINWRRCSQLAAILIYISCSTGCRDSSLKNHGTALSQKAAMGQGTAKQTLPDHIVVEKLELLSNTFILNQHHICTEIPVREDIAFDPKVIGIKFNALASFENAGLKSNCMTLWLVIVSNGGSPKASIKASEESRMKESYNEGVAASLEVSRRFSKQELSTRKSRSI